MKQGMIFQNETSKIFHYLWNFYLNNSKKIEFNTPYLLVLWQQIQLMFANS